MVDVIVLWRDALQRCNGEKGKVHIKDIHTGEEISVSFAQINKAIKNGLVKAIDRDGNSIKDINNTVVVKEEIPYENKKYIHNISAKIRKIRKLRYNIDELCKDYSFSNDKFFVLYNDYKENCSKYSISSLRIYNKKFTSLVKYYKKLLDTVIKDVEKERKALEKARLLEEKERMQTEARIIYERAQLEKMKWYQNEMIRLNSINESAHKIFESANACKNIVYKCRVGLYGKAFKNKKYATDNMELNELINNLVKCIEVYNLYCSRLIYKLDEKSRSVFKIYLLEPIDLELKQCVSYLQTLSEKGYKFCIDSELLDTYRDNALEQYNSEWGV